LPVCRRKIHVVKQRHALAALIDDVRSANGWSDPDVVARAASKGHKLSKSNISRIRNTPVVTLNIETVSALADGLGVSKAMVAQAALASMGIVTYNSADMTTEEAIRRDPSLGERDKQLLLTVLGSIRESTDADERSLRNELVHGHGKPVDIRKAGERRNTRAGQKTASGSESETVVPLSDDAIDRLHQERWETLAAKKAPGGIAHDQNPEDT
jgi:hypothetical protein